MTAWFQRRITLSSWIGWVFPMQARENTSAETNTAMEALAVHPGILELTFCAPDMPSVASSCCPTQSLSTGLCGAPFSPTI
jgi:hypothetical protein